MSIGASPLSERRSRHHVVRLGYYASTGHPKTKETHAPISTCPPKTQDDSSHGGEWAAPQSHRRSTSSCFWRSGQTPPESIFAWCIQWLDDPDRNVLPHTPGRTTTHPFRLIVVFRGFRDRSEQGAGMAAYLGAEGGGSREGVPIEYPQRSGRCGQYGRAWNQWGGQQHRSPAFEREFRQGWEGDRRDGIKARQLYCSHQLQPDGRILTTRSS